MINIMTIVFKMKSVLESRNISIPTIQSRSLKNASNHRDYAPEQHRVSPSNLIDDEGDERSGSDTTQRIHGSHETQ